jgi:hypothetical protein
MTRYQYSRTYTKTYFLSLHVIAFALVSVLSSSFAVQENKKNRTFLVEGIKIIVSESQVTATRNSKQIWQEKEYVKYYPEKSQTFGGGILLVYGESSGAKTFNQGKLLEIRTGKELALPPGDVYLSDRGSIYFDDVSRSDENMLMTRSNWGNIKLLKFDIKTRTSRQLVVDFPENLIPKYCLHKPTANESFFIQYFSFWKKSGDTWYFQYDNENCHLTLSFLESKLSAKIHIERKK